MEAEESPHRARDLRDSLLKLVAHPAGQGRVDRILAPMLTNPYPRYRDIALVTLGRVAAAAPEDADAWVRETLRRILMAGLDIEGVTFTFDLPFTLLEEAKRRGLPESQQRDLPEHCRLALESPSRWGTTMRGYSALAAALFRQGEKDQAFKVLEQAAAEPEGFAGYATLHFLAVANRWFEFGQPYRVAEPRAAWRPESLIEAAAEQAQVVRDAAFRQRRIELVETYRAWLAQDEAPDAETGLADLERIPDYDTRLAYMDHLSARWAWPVDAPNWRGLKALVPLALVNGTTLNAVLGRLLGLYLIHRDVYPLSDDDVVEAIDACSSDLMTGQPWKLGQWR